MISVQSSLPPKSFGSPLAKFSQVEVAPERYEKKKRR